MLAIPHAEAARDERPALIFGDRVVSHRELGAEVARLAAGLRARFAPGDVLALWLPNGPELLCLVLACFRAGVVPLPLHGGMKSAEVASILTRTAPRALLGAPDLRPPPPFLVYADLPGDGDGGGDHRGAPGDVVLVLLTSGSNGLPKAVQLSRTALQQVLRHRIATMRLAADSVSVVGSCLTQSVGLYQSLALLAAGGKIVLLPDYAPDPLVAAVHRHAPTHLVMAVEAFDRLLHDPRVTPDSLRSLVFACAGADRVTRRVRDRYAALTGASLHSSYGLTESSWALLNAGRRADKLLALGRPAAGVALRILDAHGRDAADGEIGELHVKSPRTMLGYRNDEALTRATLKAGWLATGDLAWRDADGWYWFAGRAKNLIVLASGDNVSPVEVENAILGHPAVDKCVVVGHTDGDGAEVPCAYVQRRDAALSREALLEFLRVRLSDFKLPREVRFVPELPLGLTGKVRRDAPPPAAPG